MKISLSGYKVINLFDLELNRLTIISKNKSFRISIKKLKISVFNWFIFIIFVIYIRLIGYRHIDLFFNFFSKFTEKKIASLKLDQVEIYHLKKDGSSVPDAKRSNLINFVSSYFDFELFSVRLLSEYKLLGKTFLFGTNIGSIYKKNYSFRKTIIFIRRISVRFNEYFDDISTYDIIDLIGLKAYFFSILKDQETILAFPGLLNIDMVNSNYESFITIIEDNIEKVYSGIYLSIPLLNYVFFNIKSLFINKNGSSLIHNMFNWKLKILINFKRIFLETYESNKLFLTISSIVFTLEYNMHNFSLVIKLLNCYLLINLENSIRILESIIYFDFKDKIIRANMKYLRLYSKAIHYNSLDNFIDVIEIPEMNIFSTKIEHCIENFSIVFFTCIELNSELLIIKLTGLDEIFCQNVEFKNEISDLLEFSNNYLLVSNNEESVNTIFYTPLERIKNKNLNIQINFNFNSNIQLIYNMNNIELNIERSRANLTFNSNEKFLKITDFELAQYNYLYENVFSMKIKTILLNFKTRNKSIFLQEIVFEKESTICILLKDISIFIIGNSCNLSAKSINIYLYLNTSLNYDSIFTVFEIEYVNFIFQKTIYCWKSIEIYRIIIKQCFSKDEPLFYELIRIDEDLIKICNENLSNKYLTICIPKLLLAASNYQIMKLSNLFSNLKQNSLVKTRISQLNLIITLNNASIHYYFHSENRCTTLLAYFENGKIFLSINDKYEIDISSKFNRVEIMAGEIHIVNDKIIKLPHYSETLYSKLHNRNIYCDIVYYEIAKKIKTNLLIDEGKIQNSGFKDKIFPIFISSIDISHNIHIKLRKNTKIRVHYNFSKDSFLVNSNLVNSTMLILIDVHDYVNSNELFYSINSDNNKCKLSTFLEKINDICLFEIRFQCLNMLLIKTQLESKYLILNLNGILFSNLNSFELYIEEFKIFAKYPSNNFSGEYINLIINNNLIKANLKILDSKMVFFAEKLIFNLKFLIREFVCKIEAVQLKVSKNLMDVVVGIAFDSEFSHKKNELYSIKYYRGTNSFHYLFDLRQSRAFVNNLMLLSNEDVSVVPYFHINCLSNAKFNIKNIEVPLFYNSEYLLDLNNSFFDKIYSSYNEPFYSRYFNDNIFSINCRIDLNVFNLNNISSEIPYSKLCDFSAGNATVGLKICFSSKVFKDLILFFGSKVPTCSDIFERAIKIRKNQKIEIPFDLIADFPNMMVFKDTNSINIMEFDSAFSQNNSVSIIDIIKNVIENPKAFYLDYNLINSSLCIGFECINYRGSCININIFNIISIINISGESLSFSFCNPYNNKLEYECIVENLNQEFIDNVDTKIDSVLLINDPMKITHRFYIEFNRVSRAENHCSIKENIIELNETGSQANSKNYRLSLIKDKISFIIIIWCPLIIVNYSNLDCILKIINAENQEYYFLEGKISKNNSWNSREKRNFSNKNIFSLSNIDKKDFIELEIQSGCYISTFSPSRQRENDILIEVEDYKHLLKSNFILSILERHSIKIKVVKLMPIWSIRNKSNFNIRITYGKHVNIPIKSNSGYLDNTYLVRNTHFNYDIQEQIKIVFDEFVNFFLINLTKHEPYERLINLYRNDRNPNKEWKLIKISFYPIQNGSVTKFNTGIYIELNNFNENESSNYFVFENKTSFTYLLTQANGLLDFNSIDVNIHRKENLTQKIWENTLIEKLSKVSLYDNKILNKFSICLVPEQINNQLFFWAKESIQDNSPITVSFYDEKNNLKVTLEQIPAYLFINGGTKLIRFSHYDSNGKNNIYQFLLSIFKFENEITHIVFHTSSFIQTHYTIIPSFFIQRQIEYQLVAREEITNNYFLNIKKFELILFNEIDSDKVLKVKWTSTPTNSPKESQKNLSLFPSPRKNELIDFSPVFHILFEHLSVNIQEEAKKLELFDSAYKIHSNLNKVCCKISNYESTIFEVNNHRSEINQNQITIIFDCFKLKERVNNKPKFSEKYQIKDLIIQIPFMDFNLNLNIYFRNFLHNFVTESQVNLNDAYKPTNNEYILIIDIFPYELCINELFINKKLRIVNCKHSINSPKRIAINEFNSIINLSKHLLKNTTYIIVKTLLNKSLNPLIYF
ncbi:unnamed protein product [Cryptosporidium hominis]|uniref:Uncharacterized protein n=2 Tax=Cryptosporidium hominis TaxID=237895 RepID=A0A0S4TBZ0_CRYHO|nr:Uncharacterized protein GY17_00001269 [Cryptosporidium hominis]CUV04203.1 unnamed protein product [Cryptosporidium hominis]|eukprot:PPS97301.1 Uncharacterized protein GY17_00001269 [Cryptosporidium hominis]